MGKPGRPTKCTPKLIKRTQEFADGAWKDDGIAVYPSVLGLALYLKVSRKAIWEWVGRAETSKNPVFKSFGNIVKMIELEKEHYLSSLGAAGKLSPKITSLLLSQCGVIEVKERRVKEESKREVSLSPELKEMIEAIRK